MLPKIDVPLYSITLPLSNKKIKIRPFLVKEEKILLMAMESNDEESILLAIKQIVNNCCMDKIDVDELPILDLEFIFLNLRARSIGEMVELEYKCNNDIKVEEETKKCENLVKIEFNLLDIEIKKQSENKKKIQLTKKLGVMMKYPNFNVIKNVENLSETEQIGKMIANCIEYIFDDETIYYTKDVSEQEVVDFIDSLTSEQFLKIQEFLNDVPKLEKTLKFKCNKCSYEEDLRLEGIQSFFV
jgi:hypothetical protein